MKVSACNVGDLGSILGSGKIPWRRTWLPTPIFLPREWTEELVGYNSWGHKESDTIERLIL